MNHKRWAWLGTLVLTALGLGWVVLLLFKSIAEQGLDLFIPKHPEWLLAGTLLLLGSLWLNAVNFHQFLTAASTQPVALPLSMRLHLTGQVVRYLPGRFWGVLYQINAARETLSAASITRANVDLMVFALFGNVSVAATILGLTQRISLLWAIGLALGGLGVLMGAFLGGLTNIFHTTAKWLPPRMQAFVAALAESRLPFFTLLSTSFIFLLSWGLYLMAWYALGQAFAAWTVIEGLALSAWYTLAWLVGFMAALTPGGLGVREAAFVLLAGQESEVGMLALAVILMRVWLMLSDLLLGLLAVMFKS